MKKQNLLAILAAGLLPFLPGCTTYQGNLNSVPLNKKEVTALRQMSAQPSSSQTAVGSRGSFSEAELLEADYSALPRGHFTFQVVGGERYELNTGFTGWLNNGENQGTLRALEKLIPESSVDSYLSLENPDLFNFANRKAQRNQPLSDRVLHSVGDFSAEGNSGFDFFVKQHRKLAEDRYNVTINFANGSFSAEQTKSGVGDTAYSALEVGGAGALAGPIGAGIAAGVNLGEGIYAHYGAKNNLPNGTSFSAKRNYPDANKRAARVYTLCYAAAGHENAVVHLHSYNGGLGFAVADNAENVQSTSDGELTMTTHFDGGNLRALVYSGVRIAPYAVGRLLERDVKYREAPSGVTGGRTDGPEVGAITGGRTDGPEVGGKP